MTAAALHVFASVPLTKGSIATLHILQRQLLHNACSYSDYTKTESGLQFSDLKEGSGPAPGPNSLCTVDWDGAKSVRMIKGFIPPWLSHSHADNIIAKPLPASPACCAAGYTIGYYGRPFEARNKVSGTLGNLLASSIDVCCWAMSNSRLWSHAYTDCRRRAAALREMTKTT